MNPGDTECRELPFQLDDTYPESTQSINRILGLILPSTLYSTLFAGLVFGIVAVVLFWIRILSSEERLIYITQFVASGCCCCCFVVPLTLTLLLDKELSAVTTLSSTKGVFIYICLAVVCCSSTIFILISITRCLKGQKSRALSTRAKCTRVITP